MKLIVGLGNPGSEYDGTRHNAGFIVVDRLAQRHNLTAQARVRSRFHSATLEAPLCGQGCLLLRPMTYMNRSGRAVQEAVAFYKLDAARDLLVLVDDVALPCGRIRLRASGGPGGHNGLADIERALSSQDYPRLRIGVDGPGAAPQRDYVLGRFSPEQRDRLLPAVEAACDAIECWLTDGLDIAMTRYNAPTA